MSDSSMSDASEVLMKPYEDWSMTNEVFRETYNVEFRNNLTENSLSIVTPTSFIYHALSAISDKIGGVIYSNIVNYIDNIANVDVCKIQALESMMKMFGVNYSIVTLTHAIPLELLNALNLLSINRSLLLNSSIIHEKLIEQLSALILEENTNKVNISSDTALCSTVSVQDYIDEAKFKEFLIGTYKHIIYDNLTKIYLDPITEEPVYSNSGLYDSYILNSHVLLTKTEEEKQERTDFKLKYGIRHDFNEETEFDNIEDGITQYSDYSTYEQLLLDIEDTYRHKAYKASSPITRNYYYRVQHVQLYIDFIEKYYTDILHEYDTVKEYDVDNDYFELSPQQYSVLKKNGSRVVLDEAIINTVLDKLAISTIQIANLRDQLKIQAKLLNLKGTFLLLEFLVYDFLRENTIDSINKLTDLTLTFNNKTTKLNLIRYSDPTEYFNISCNTDLSIGLLSSSLQPRYWEDQGGILGINPIDDTNIFAPLDTTKTYNYAFLNSEVEKFYLSSLFSTFKTVSSDFIVLSADSSGDPIEVEVSYLQTQNTHLLNFISTICNLGADTTRYYLSTGEISTQHRSNAYAKSLLDIYGGMLSANSPYNNIKNTVHPSYLLHPYIYNFIEEVENLYLIENTLTLIASTMFDLLKANIDQYIDEDGYISAVWNNPLNSNSDYITRYEKSNHIDELNHINCLYGYDGFGYPAAIKDCLLSISFVKNIKSNTNRWYSGLNLSQLERQRIANLHSTFKAAIKKIAKDEFFDIYRYGLDIYGNSYILLKKYTRVTCIADMKNVDNKTRETTPGMLWIKYNNYPIAFPAYYYGDNKTNDNELALILVVDNSVDDLKDAEKWTDLFVGLPKIYDFYIAEDKTHLELLFKTEDGHKQVIPASIQKTYVKDINYKRNFLKLIAYGKDGDCDGYLIEDDYQFKQFMTLDQKIGFIELRVRNASEDSENTDKYLDFNIKTFTDDLDELATIDNKLSISLSGSLIESPFSFTTDSAKIDVYDDQMTVAYLKNLNDSTEVEDYFWAQFKYSNLANDTYHLSTFNKTLVLKKYVFNEQEITEYGDIRNYTPYVDVGFYPAVGNSLSSILDPTEDPTVDLAFTATTLRFDDTSIAKFQLIGEPVAKGIDYKLHLPIRMYEKYTWSLFPLVEGKLSAVSYNKAHFYENTRPKDCGDDTAIIYKPYDLYRALQLNNPDDDVSLNLKVDESFTNVFRDIDQNNIFLKYDKVNINPWLLKCPSNTTIEAEYPHYVYPGKPGLGVSSDVSNIIPIRIRLDEDGDEIRLSTMWSYNEDNDIKIDINPQYFNNERFTGYRNAYNLQHTFLNLDYPGSGGYLKVYKNSAPLPTANLTDISYFYDDLNIEAVLFLKNISDSKPKLLIVKDWPVEKQAVYRKRAEVLGIEDTIAIHLELDDDNVTLITI